MKPIGARVRLRVDHWPCDLAPRRGDALRTPTGRTYKVIVKKGNTIICRIAGPDAKARGFIYEIAWSSGRRSKRGKAPVL